MRRLAILSLFLGACSAVPADPDGTLNRIRDTREFRVGMVARGTPASAKEQRFLSGIENAAGARGRVEFGSTEQLLGRLQRGDLDLVVGEFDPVSPWYTHVTFLPSLSGRSADASGVLPAAAARNGENAWIGLLHSQSQLLGEGQ